MRRVMWISSLDGLRVHAKLNVDTRTFTILYITACSFAYWSMLVAQSMFLISSLNFDLMYSRPFMETTGL
jgi:hypothetical protein